MISTVGLICSAFGFSGSWQALSLSLKLTFAGHSQLGKGSFWGFVILVTVSIVTQMNYLNKVCAAGQPQFFSGPMFFERVQVVFRFDLFMSNKMTPKRHGSVCTFAEHTRRCFTVLGAGYVQYSYCNTDLLRTFHHRNYHSVCHPLQRLGQRYVQRFPMLARNVKNGLLPTCVLSCLPG